MNDYLIYLTLPPYLVQWYANECTQIHNRDKMTCPRDVYKFPTPAVPVRGSQESDVINMHLAKQPSNVPAKVPDDATIAIVIPHLPANRSSIITMCLSPDWSIWPKPSATASRSNCLRISMRHGAKLRRRGSICSSLHGWRITVLSMTIPTSTPCSRYTSAAVKRIAKRPNRKKSKKFAISIGRIFDNHSFLFHITPLYSISS